ncbi:MAG: hypothetical protein WBL61_10810 [Bryobacteraceae bacterium]
MPNLFRGARAGGPESDAVPVSDTPVPLDGATVRRCGEKIALFAPPRAGVLVNGRPVDAGIRVLAHRDQIHAGSGVWWFSAEDPPEVVPFPGGAGVVCPRCRLPVLAGEPAVRCPCGNWLHEYPERPCYAYGPVCPICQRATVLGGAPALSLEE